MSHDRLVIDGPNGRVELTGAALASLATRSAEMVPGVRLRRPRRRLRLCVEPSSVRVELGVEAALGDSLPDRGEAVQRSVARAIESATGLPTSVDVTFEELA
jgi:uncharacterized alkaline shock family protein YloU